MECRWPIALGSLLLAALASCSVRDDVLRPLIVQQASDPVVLAELCGVEPEALGPISASRLRVSEIDNDKGAEGGEGRARLRYEPLGEALAGKTCSGVMHFRFSSRGGTTGDPTLTLTTFSLAVDP